MKIYPHELGMTVRIKTTRTGGASHNGQMGTIDEIAIYGTTAHGVNFEGWDVLVGFHNGASHAYCAFYFDELEIVRDPVADLSKRVAELEAQAEGLRTDYGSEWRDATHTGPWYTTWGFTTPERARHHYEKRAGFEGRVVQRFIGEPRAVLEAITTDGTDG
jgi:hypothetical protein